MIHLPVKISKRSATAQVIALLEQGYTIRRGTYAPRRGFPRWQWQLFTPAGEFVQAISTATLNRMDEAGYKWTRTSESGINRSQS